MKIILIIGLLILLACEKQDDRTIELGRENAGGKPLPAAHTHVLSDITDLVRVQISTLPGIIQVMTTAQINSLTGDLTGKIVIDSDLNVLKYHDGLTWKTLN